MTKYEYWYGKLDAYYTELFAKDGVDIHRTTWHGVTCEDIASHMNAEIWEEHMRWAASAVLLVVTIALVAFIFIA